MNKYKYKNKYVGGRRKYSNDEDSRTACDYMERGATCVGTTASQWGGMGDIAMLHFYLVCGIGSSSIPGAGIVGIAAIQYCNSWGNVAFLHGCGIGSSNIPGGYWWC